jgi:4-amino-4-deoxy-L-arabinose transferase-like glycosyltransferase
MKWLADQYGRINLPGISDKLQPSTLAPITRLDGILAAIMGLGALMLYVRTLAPSLQYADSGEFQTLVYSLGTSHPTGYQVYVLLGHLFTLLPIGDLAYRVNLFSAFLGALTVSMMYLIVRILTARRLAGLMAALGLGVFPLFWYYAVFAESYVPSSAFMSGVILALLLWRQSGKHQWLVLSGLLGGLSLGVHVSAALVAPGVLFYLLVCMKDTQNEGARWRISKHWWAALAGLFLGIAMTGGAFLALDANDAKADYFHAVVEPNISVFRLEKEDIKSPFERFVFQFTARQFRRAMFDNPALVWPVRLGIFTSMIRSFFHPSTIALILCGLVSLLIQKWREGLLLVIGWTVTMFFMMNYNIIVADVLVFFFPIIIYVWLGTGIATLMQAISIIVRRALSNREAVIASTLIVLVLFGWMIKNYRVTVLDAWRERKVSFMIGNEFAVYSYPINNPGEVREEALNLVNAVEDGSVVFLGWRLLFPAYFVAHVEGVSPDTIFHESIQRVKGQPDIYISTAEYIKEIVINRQVFFYGECPRGPLIDQFSVKQQTRDGVALCEVLGLRD